MLSIMSLAYQGAGTEEIVRQKFDSEEQRRHIFNLYVEQMFKRKGTISLGFRKEKIIELALVAGREDEETFAVALPRGGTPTELVRHKSQRGSI
jgi:hypothetical protein